MYHLLRSTQSVLTLTLPVVVVLQVGTCSHDHQQQHQQAHLLFPRVTLQNSSHCFRTLGLWIFSIWIEFIFHILEYMNSLVTDQNILRVTSLDTMGFLLWKDILTPEMLVI